MFIVLTNDPDITYEKVSRSIFSSNSNDRLKDTVITGMHVLDENGEIIEFDEADEVTDLIPSSGIATDPEP